MAPAPNAGSWTIRVIRSPPTGHPLTDSFPADGVTINARLDSSWPPSVLARGLAVTGDELVDVVAEVDGEPDLVMDMAVDGVVEEFVDEWGDWAPLGAQLVPGLFA